MIAKLKEMLVRHEGEVNHAYQDSEGYWTIGIGHLIDKRKGGKISHKISMLILDDDIAEKLGQCERAFDWFDELSEIRKIVILSMVFNLGIDGFKKFKKTIKYIENDEFEEASKEMLDSAWLIQVGNRAIELSQMMKTNEY